MIRLLHLSDIHMGRDRADLAQALLAAAQGLGAQATILSGDLTQRARPRQFQAARAFLDALPQPHLVVPGNHDIPLDRPLTRLLHPWSAYAAAFGPDRAPCLDLDGVRVVGITSATPFAQQRGHITRTALAQACAQLEQAPAGSVRVAALHHPLLHPPGSKKPAMWGGARAARALVEAGADLLLSGHLHAWEAAVGRIRTPTRTAIALSCGTSLSTRVRGEGNDWACIDIDTCARRVAITRWYAPPGAPGFAPQPALIYVDTPDGWQVRADP